MNVELKNVKICEWMSQETCCYSATVYVNGSRAFTVENSGHGGCDNHHVLDQNLYQKFLSHVKKSGESVDTFMAMELDKWELNKKLKKRCKKQTVVKMVGQNEDQWTVFKVPFSQSVKSALLKKFGSKIVRFVNEEV